MFKLSKQAIGSLMMALQLAIKNVSEGKEKDECDISLIMKDFRLENTKDGLIVINPPMLDYTDKTKEVEFN